MKKFRLKPLGELRQKFSMNWFFIGLVMALCVSACSNDDDEKIAPTFPEKQTIESSANDTKELSFEASADWQLTTSATWCRFVVDGKEEFSLSGTAGNHTVTIKVTDEAQQPDAKSIAQITLMMGANKAVIADVARNAKDLFLTVYDAEGNEIGEDGVIKVGYKDYNSFKVKANFRFAATNKPEWLDLQGGALVGTVNEEVVSGVRIVEEAKFFKYTQDGKITFADDKGLYSKSYKLAFEGMDRDEIIVSGNQWNWEVSLDGKIITQTSNAGASASTTEATFNKFVPFTITAFDDDYVMVYVEQWTGLNGSSGFDISYDEEEYPLISWIQTKKDKENIKITIDAAKEERSAYIYTFPRGLFNQIKGDLAGKILDEENEDGLNYEYSERFMVMSFLQKEKKTNESVNFKIINAFHEGYGQEIEYKKYTEGDADYFKNKYNVQSIYEIIDPTQSISIEYKTNIASWECRDFNLLEGPDNTGICGQVENKISAFTKDLSKDIFIVIIDEDNNGDMFIIKAIN